VINVKDKKLQQDFGSSVRKLRLDRGLSQEALANLADVPLSQIGRLERGEINCTISTINALAKALKLELYELFLFCVSDPFPFTVIAGFVVLIVRFLVPVCANVLYCCTYWTCSASAINCR
jgi:transcriptional regulator with XRE-family HTH domain